MDHKIYPKLVLWTACFMWDISIWVTESYCFFWKLLICLHEVFYGRRFLSITGKFMLETFPILLYNSIFLKSWNGFQSSPKSFRFFTDEHVDNVICADVVMLPILNSLLTCSLIWFYSYLFSILSWMVIVKKMDENIQKILLLSWNPG